MDSFYQEFKRRQDSISRIAEIQNMLWGWRDELEMPDEQVIGELIKSGWLAITPYKVVMDGNDIQLIFVDNGTLRDAIPFSTKSQYYYQSFAPEGTKHSYAIMIDINPYKDEMEEYELDEWHEELIVVEISIAQNAYQNEDTLSYVQELYGVKEGSLKNA